MIFILKKRKVILFIIKFALFNCFLKLKMQFLNLENMARSTAEVEFHPLKPFLPKNAKVLFLGSFPPQRKRWSMDFFYPNFINDHWRIEGQIWFGDRNHFVDMEHKCFKMNEIVNFLNEKGIAFFAMGSLKIS